MEKIEPQPIHTRIYDKERKRTASKERDKLGYTTRK